MCLNRRTDKSLEPAAHDCVEKPMEMEHGLKPDEHRESPFGAPNSYLNGVTLDTLKVVITLSTRNTLMELTDFFHQTILDADAGNARPPKDLIDGKLSTLATPDGGGTKRQANLSTLMAVKDRNSFKK